MSLSVWRRDVPPRLSVFVVSVVTAFGVGVAYLTTDTRPSPPPPLRGSPPAEAVLSPGTYPSEPLARGTEFPSLDAAGWVNGPPAATLGRLTVVDLWADWCPVCRYTAPGLVAAYHSHHTCGVDFVSLTPNPRTAAEAFATEFAVPWPCGYGASADTVARFGAYSTDRMFSDYHPRSPGFHVGHELNPTMYLVGPDGRVLWNDAQARPRHTKDAAGVIAELDSAIRGALAGDLSPE